MTRHPVDRLGNLIVLGICALLAAGGIYAVLFAAGWILLQIYDALAAWLGV